jgi:Zn ribbon nucleic-acid-binding protein
MKNMHNEYNNIYYWSNDFVNLLEAVRSGEKKNETNEELN